MKANELRLGNLINFPFIGADVEVIGFALKSEGTLYVQSRLNKNTFFESPEKYKPIPLTEEWLVKFGAEVIKFINKENQYRIGYDLFVVRNGKIFHYGTSVCLDYVHTLQNLIFALRNEELTLKPC